MAIISRLLLPFASSACFAVAENTVVVGYVPDYRFDSLDWDGIVKHTTHVNLFSLEPSATGDLLTTDPMRNILASDSALSSALARVGPKAPKVLVALGGAGRSQHFPKAVGSSKMRKKLAEQVRRLFDAAPLLSGVDIDWEVPQSQEQYNDLGKFVKELRLAFEPRPLLVTTTYHPRSGAVAAMASIRGKSSGKSLVDLFDMVHSMAYTRYDSDRRHSSPQLDRQVEEEWLGAGLPKGKLTLGMPFFGVARKTGEALTYGQLVDAEPSLVDRRGVDETSSGAFFVNARSLTQKVRFAQDAGFAGVMIWELGQDKPVSSGMSLLQHVWRTAQTGVVLEKSWGEAILTQIYAFGEDELMGMVASIIGAMLLYKVLFQVHVRQKYQPEPRPQEPKGAPLKAEASEPAAAVTTEDGAPAEASGDAKEE